MLTSSVYEMCKCVKASEDTKYLNAYRGGGRGKGVVYALNKVVLWW